MKTNKKLMIVITILLVLNLIFSGFLFYRDTQLIDLQSQKLEVDQRQTEEIGGLMNRQSKLVDILEDIMNYLE